MAERCLVTGHGGFLGRYVCAELANAGYDVFGLGHFRLPDDGLVEFLSTRQPSVVVHLAGPASVALSLTSPEKDFHGSVVATASLLFALAQLGATPKLVHVSSAAVYGNPAALPIDENAPVRPISPYGFHRSLTESLIDEAVAQFGIRASVARVFSAYGPGLRRQVVHDVCQRALREGAVRLDGTGNESRDFVHALDVARAVRVLVEAAPGDGSRYNVASGNEVTLGQLATIVAEAAGGLEVRFSGRQRLGDPLRWVADVSRLRALGWEPTVPLERGIVEVLHWLESAES